MSSLQYAYSEELNDVISIDDAYDLFWQGKLTDKKMFQCPGNNCRAQITCACMGTVELELKQSPNFRVYGQHSPDCEYLSFLERDGSGRGQGGQDKSEQNCAEFMLQRKQKPLEIMGLSSPVERQTVQNKVHGGYGAYSARPKFYSIRPIVDRFFAFREDGVLNDRFIKVNGEARTYKQIFKGIFNQNPQMINDKSFIFWGLAYINRTKKNDAFQIRFSENFIHEEKKIRPSILVKDSHLDQYPFNKRLRQYLNQVSVDQDIQLLTFIYGGLVLRQKNESTYINIEFGSLVSCAVSYI